MEVTKHTPGTFCWIEIGTTDQAAGKKFYSELFGWAIDDVPIGPDEVYTMFKLKGKDVAALYQLRPEMISQGIPPHLMPYICVENVDRSVEAVKAAGGTMTVEPFDVFEHGRMAVAQDPAGASFSMWQPKQHIGVGIIGESNSICWNELMTRDVPGAKTFYGKVFGWNNETKGDYTEFFLGDAKTGHHFGGMMEIKAEWGPMPPAWGTYFAVDDCDGIVAKAQKLGAKTCMPPTDIPGVGRFSTLADPQGATFCVIQLVSHLA